jgi:hypothetical protein
MDDKHTIAVNTLKTLLKPFTDEYAHIHNIQLANLVFPYNTIPLTSPPEEWKPVINKAFIKDRYIVSSWGRVFDVKLQQYPYSHLCDKGYIRIGIGLNKDTSNVNPHTSVRVHRLVADAFLPPIEGKEIVNHKNTIKTDNTLANLEWTTNLENLDHANRNGCNLNKSGYRYFTRDEINYIRELHKNGETITKIAKRYNKKSRCISDIVNNKTYDDSFWDNLGYYSNKHYGLYSST